jgi:hypothetical protein
VTKTSIGGWIKWAGGDRPVSALETVEYRMRDHGKGTSIADDLDWRHFPKENPFRNGDIVAYRVVLP